MIEMEFYLKIDGQQTSPRRFKFRSKITNLYISVRLQTSRHLFADEMATNISVIDVLHFFYLEIKTKNQLLCFMNFALITHLCVKIRLKAG